MSHVHTLRGSGCMPRISPLPINSREGWSRGQSGWRVNLDPPPWMFRWCHKPDPWPRSLAATRPTLNLNFRGPNASVHTQTHANTYSSTAHVHAHKCTRKMQHLKQFEAKSCINMSPKMRCTFFHCGKDYRMTTTDSLFVFHSQTSSCADRSTVCFLQETKWQQNHLSRCVLKVWHQIIKKACTITRWFPEILKSTTVGVGWVGRALTQVPTALSSVSAPARVMWWIQGVEGLTCIKDGGNWSSRYVSRHSWDILCTAPRKTLTYKRNNIVQAMIPLVLFLGPIKLLLDTNGAMTMLQ